MPQRSSHAPYGSARVQQLCLGRIGKESGQNNSDRFIRAISAATGLRAEIYLPLLIDSLYMLNNIFPEEHVVYRYKYLPFSEGSLKTLEESTIKFTCPLEFNDPFDCFPYYSTKSVNQIPRTRPDLIKAVGKAKGLSPAKRLLSQHKFISNLRRRVGDGSFATGLMKDVGVVSLSKNALNILMWSHYADFHRGFVLEFRIPILGTKEDYLLAEQRLLPMPVQYSHERPHIDMGVEPPKDLLEKLLLTKSIDWEYEEEERVIDRNRGPGIHTYRRDEILTSVIAGLKIRDNDYSRLQSLVRESSNKTDIGVTLYRVQATTGQYILEVPNHPRVNSYSNRINK